MKTSTQTYQHTITKFGDFDLVKISNGINEMTLVPEYGGHLIALNMIVNGQLINILDSYNSPEALIEQDFYKSSFLLPYPNRLKDGQFQYNGKSYSFPINDKATQNGLHGFKDFYKMSIESIITEEDYAEITLKNNYQGQNPSFPFPFEFTLTYILKGFNDFTCQINIYNPTHQTIPIGFGWHPYFRLGNLPVDNLELQMPAVEQVLIDNRMLPTGAVTLVDQYQSLQSLSNQNFDTGFKTTTTGISEVVLHAPSLNTKLSYWQENDVFPYFQLFIPPKRQSIAIEPMTCNINAFNSKADLKELEAQKSIHGSFGVRLLSC